MLSRAEIFLKDVDPKMAELIEQHGPCNYAPWKQSLFPSLINSIISQQLSVKVAKAISGRLLALMPVGSPEELILSPKVITELSVEELRGCGLSKAKTGYCQFLAKAVYEGELDLESLTDKVDDEIIAAATGTALDGLGVANPFPDAQKVFGVTVDVYDTSLNFDLVTQVTETFLENDIDPDEPKCMVIGPVQARKLLQLTEATSGDYVYVKALAEMGYIDNWMGYQWIVSTRLNHPTAPGTDIDCFALTQKAIGLMVDRDVTSRIAEDPSISFAWRIYSFMTIGAVRVEDEHIVNLQLADTI